MLKNQKVFYNYDSEIKPKGFIDILKWKVRSKQPIWPKKLPINVTDIPPVIVNERKTRVSFVGHVTFLIQTQGLNILTDPVWSERTSPISFAGPKRVKEPGIKFDDLPIIDIILISHNHYDHMDIETLRKLWHRDKPQIITPLENDIILKSNIQGIEVNTLDWHEKITVKNNVDIHLESAQHWSARGLFDQNRALWGTFIIKLNHGSICFIGDSGYNSKIFKNIGEKYNDIFLSLIPIGAFEPRWFMKDIHMNPEEAVLVHEDLKSTYSIGSHFETFQLADDGFHQASQELKEALVKHKIGSNTFITPEVGKSYYF